jgi:hypothetical protein
MADFAASNVTYTMLKQRRIDGLNHNLVRLAFGDGALTYAAAGIPLTKGHLGCPNDVQSLVVVDQGVSGYVFQYDQSAEKLVALYGNYDAADGVLIEPTAVAIAAQTIEVEVVGW